VKLTDYDGQYTHFTGFMLEEEIVASFWVLITRNGKINIDWQILTRKNNLIWSITENGRKSIRFLFTKRREFFFEILNVYANN
jgi:hypothetical protein